VFVATGLVLVATGLVLVATGLVPLLSEETGIDETDSGGRRSGDVARDAERGGSAVASAQPTELIIAASAKSEST
jgi:hypothetical protein